MPIHDILTTIAALAAVIIMILLIRFGTRFLGVIPRRGLISGAMSVEATFSLDPRRRLSLVKCQGHQLLLLTGGPNDVFLGWLPPATASSMEYRP